MYLKIAHITQQRELTLNEVKDKEDDLSLTKKYNEIAEEHHCKMVSCIESTISKLSSDLKSVKDILITPVGSVPAGFCVNTKSLATLDLQIVSSTESFALRS